MENSLFNSTKPLALVTGASGNVGYELAKIFAKNGFDLLVVAADRGILEAGNAFRSLGAQTETFQVDISTPEGVESLYQKIKHLPKPLDAVAMNAGFAVTGDFVKTDLNTELRMMGLNNSGLVHLTKLILPDLIQEGHGRLLYTACLTSFMPGTHHAVYAATTAFVEAFADAIRNEVKDFGISVTSLIPDLSDDVTENTRLESARIAQDAYFAMMAGKDQAVPGSLMNSLHNRFTNFISHR